MREAWKRPCCTGMLQVRRLLAQEMLRAGVYPHCCLLSGGYSLFLLLLTFLPALGMCSRWDCSAGQKRSPSLLPLAVSSLGFLGGYGKKHLTLPFRDFLSLPLTSSFCRYFPAQVPLISNRLILPTAFIL